MWPNPQETADLFTFTQAIFNKNLHLLYFVDYKATQTGSRTTATSKTELISGNFWQLPLIKNFSKMSILDVADVPDPILITDNFAQQMWVLINVKSVFPFIEIGQLVLMAERMDGCYETRIYWFQIAWKHLRWLEINFTQFSCENKIIKCFFWPTKIKGRQEEY